jgi:hypothetical protein
VKKLFLNLVAAVGTVALVQSARAQGHYHLFVSAVGTNQNDALYFDDSTLAPADTFVSTLNLTNAGTYAGYYQPGNLTIAVLAQTPANGGPVPNAPAFGSLIFVRVVSVQGPVGGEFSFWNSNTIAPTFRIPVGTTNGTNSYQAGQNNGAAGSDPYGHIHGRVFAVNKPGLYTIGFQAFDSSTNGMGGGPIQSQSPVYNFRWQAGVNIVSLDVTNSTATATFGATGGKNLSLQYSDDFTSNNWQPLGDAVAGDDHFHSITDLNATNSARFYRLVVTPSN